MCVRFREPRADASLARTLRTHSSERRSRNALFIREKPPTAAEAKHTHTHRRRRARPLPWVPSPPARAHAHVTHKTRLPAAGTTKTRAKENVLFEVKNFREAFLKRLSSSVEHWKIGGIFLYSLMNKVIKKQAIGIARKEEVIYYRIKVHSHLNSTLRITGKHPNGLCEQC